MRLKFRSSIFLSVIAFCLLTNCAPKMEGLGDGIGKAMGSVLCGMFGFGGETVFFKKEDAPFLSSLISQAKEQKIVSAGALRDQIGSQKYEQLSALVLERYDEENQNRIASGLTDFEFGVEEYIHLTMRAIVHVAGSEEPLTYNWYILLGRTKTVSEQAREIKMLAVSLPISTDERASKKSFSICDEV